MTILLVQTFLLMLLAFLLGTSIACLTRRMFSGRAAVEAPASSPQFSSVGTGGPVAATVSETDRFGRALAGGGGSAVPPVFHRTSAPVVEVQPQPAVRVAPAPPAPEPEPPPAVTPPPSGPSYTELAVVAAATAATAAAAKAKAKADAEAAQSAGQSATQVAEAVVSRFDAAAKAKADAEAAQSAGQSATQVAEAVVSRFDAAAKAKADAEAAQSAGQSATQVAEAVASRFGTPVAAALASGDGSASDDLTRIRAIDGALQERLHRLGVQRFADIAAWSAADVKRLSQSLGFQGRIEQENWIEQARILAQGGSPEDGRWRGPELSPGPIEPGLLAPVDGDRLHRIIGVDPKSEATLYANGVARLTDIAGWTAEDVERFETLIGAPGRITRENWVEQARFLTRGSAGTRAIASAGVAAAAAAVAVEASAPPAAAPEAETAESPAPAPPAQREGYTTLRSVRSEALTNVRGGFVAPPVGEVEDLKRIRGIGLLVEKKLHSLGITSYEQVANWTGADIDRISQLLDFKGRIERENWVEQARILASGGQTEFSRRVDRGEA